MDLTNVAIIGSGPTSLFLLQNIWNHIDFFKNRIHLLTIYEKECVLGMGMPYHPDTTDVYNRANISSEEIPQLQESFGDWLRKQNKETLEKFNINDVVIDDAEVYSRIALGHYFQAQFRILLNCFKSIGIKTCERCESEVVDISQTENNELIVTDYHLRKHIFSSVVIANGHVWKEEDKEKDGYYASPWPIKKILPKENEFFNFPIGTLGASLSAFDVVTSLAHRHGVFVTVKDKLKFLKHENAPKFKIVLHSAKGWLPHLQYEQQEPIREIYRHFSRNQLVNLIDNNGFIRIEDFFNTLCRPALITAFAKNKLLDVVEKLNENDFSFKDLVTLMSEKHEYINSFEGMKLEMVKAKNSVFNKMPIHWMETLDDLMYSLNYHAELLPAEDHIFFHKEVMSFLMNVIAALPLQSAEILLALYDANCIELKSGLVCLRDDSFGNDRTKIAVHSEDGKTEELEYKLFVNCAGQKKIELNDYPFQSLVDEGMVRGASAKFATQKIPNNILDSLDADSIIDDSSGISLKLCGIDIDSSYRAINKNGIANCFLYDINSMHTSGLRPYSYGLQACNATSLILVESWIAEIVQGKNINNIEDITELYEDSETL